MSFIDRLDALVLERGTPAMVGIDPHLALLPEEFGKARDTNAPRAERAEAVTRFCVELLDLVHERVAVVKPQSAFFELLGADGVQAFETVCRHARSLGLLVVGDVKRGDIASTAAAYAESFLAPDPAHGTPLCDAITVSPYLGADTLEPFVDTCRKTGGGMYVLVRTSNPGSGVFQEHGSPPLWSVVGEALERAGSDLMGECGLSSIGAVVGGTHPEELRTIRAALPNTPFLIPGFGAQGAGAEEIAGGFPDASQPLRGGVVNSSRGIAFAWRKHEGLHWKDASSRALDEMNDELVRALGVSG